MKWRWLWIAAFALAIVGVSAWTAEAPEDERLVPALASGVVVFAAGISSLLLRRHREKVTGSAAPDSFERAAATDAQARCFIDALVLGCALLAAVLVFGLEEIAAALVFGYLLVLTLDFFVRFKLLTRERV